MAEFILIFRRDIQKFTRDYKEALAMAVPEIGRKWFSWMGKLKGEGRIVSPYQRISKAGRTVIQNESGTRWNGYDYPFGLPCLFADNNRHLVPISIGMGVVAVLIPKYPLLKEWAYAGFFFVMTGAIYSHIASGDPVTAAFPALFLLLLTVVSWYFRSVGRKIVLVTQ